MSEKSSIVVVYSTHTEAEDAIRELQKSGFDLAKLSVIAKDSHTEGHVVGYYMTGDRMEYWAKGRHFGAGCGVCLRAPLILQCLVWAPF